MLNKYQFIKRLTSSNNAFLPKTLVPSASFSFMTKSNHKKAFQTPKTLNLFNFNYSFATTQEVHSSNTNQEDLNILQGIFGQKLPDVQEIMNSYASCKDLNLLKPNDQEWITTVLCNLMTTHRREGNSEKSSHYRTELEDFLDKTDTRVTYGTVNCYHFLALEYLGLEDFSKAEKYAKKADDVGKKLDDNNNIRSLLIHNRGVLAGSYLRSNQDEKALELYNTVLANADHVLDYTLQTLLINTYGDMLEIYTRRNDLKKVSEYAKKHLDVSIEKYGENSHEVFLLYLNVPFALKSPEYFTEALGYAQKALQHSKKLYPQELMREACIYYSLFGEIYKCNQNYTKALEYYEKAIQIFENLPEKNPELQSEVYSLAADAYKALGNQQEADNYLKKSSKLRSSE